MDNEKLNGSKTISMKNFIETNEKENFDVENFLKQPVDINNKTALIFMSSGTTGLPKGLKEYHLKLLFQTN